MIIDLRFVERATPIGDGTMCKTVRILQMKRDATAPIFGGVSFFEPKWEDVPLIEEVVP